MDEELREICRTLSTRPGASSSVLTGLEAKTGIALPQDYLDFMRWSNGAEGFVGEGGYVMLWPLEELARENRMYKVAERVPGLFLFGSNGGGEAFCFDTRRKSMPVVRVPFIVMILEDVLFCATSFSRFLRYLRDN